MKSYAVYAPTNPNLTPQQVTEQTVFVPQGFCWPAFFFSIIWLIYRKQLLALVVYIAAVVLFTTMGQIMNISDSAHMLMSLTLQLWLGFEARNLQMSALERKGLVRVDTVFAPQRDVAEYQFFARQMGS